MRLPGLAFTAKHRSGLLLLLIVILQLTGTLQAQNNPFIALYSAASENSTVSMFLPIGWVYRDEVASSSLFIFGENDTAAQERLDSTGKNAGEQSYSGAGGIIQIVTPKDAGVSEDATPDDLLTALNGFLKQLETYGYTTTRSSETITLPTGQGAYAIIENKYEKSLIMLLRYGSQIGLISAGTPPGDFDFYADRLVAAIESIHIPGDTVLSVPELTQAASDGTGQFSIRLPEGWIYSRAIGPTLPQAIVFGSNSFAFTELINSVENRGLQELDMAGIGGIVGYIPEITITSAGNTAEDLYKTIAASYAELPGITSEPWKIEGVEGEGILFHGYDAIVASIKNVSNGVVAGLMVIDGGLFRMTLWVNPSHDYRRSMAVMDAIAATVQFPAEDDAQLASFGKLARETPEPFDMNAQTPADDGTVLFVSRGQQLSLRLPAGWFVRDYIDTPANILAFGSTEAAAVDRQEIGRGEEMGGTAFIFAYNNSDLPPYPNNDRLKAVLNQWFTDTKATIIKEPTVINTNGGGHLVYAVYQKDEKEWGFVAIHDFGAQFVFIKLNAASEEQFNENAAILGAINDSLHMPAVIPGE